MSDFNAHVTVGDHGVLLPSSRVTVDGIDGDVAVPARDPLTGTDLFWDRVESALNQIGMQPAAGAWQDHVVDGQVAHFRAVPKEA